MQASEWGRTPAGHKACSRSCQQCGLTAMGDRGARCRSSCCPSDAQPPSDATVALVTCSTRTRQVSGLTLFAQTLLWHSAAAAGAAAAWTWHVGTASDNDMHIVAQYLSDELLQVHPRRQYSWQHAHVIDEVAWHPQPQATSMHIHARTFGV